jgi:hypothetical protein
MAQRLDGPFLSHEDDCPILLGSIHVAYWLSSRPSEQEGEGVEPLALCGPNRLSLVDEKVWEA